MSLTTPEDAPHLQSLVHAANCLIAEISEYEPSAGEDDDELVEAKLGDLKALRRAVAQVGA